MYNCPHCDEGPFSATDWWEHMSTHNTPWLQSRDPKNLERTDLGYGEDIQGMTTVPTHDLPNEPGFTPEKFGARYVDREEVWNAHPHAHDYFDVHQGTHPFIYNPEWDRLYMGKPGTGHMDLYDQFNNEHLYNHSNVWGRYFPNMEGGVDIFDPETNSPEEIDAAMRAVEHWEGKKSAWKEATLPDVPSHRMVWLSQPNNAQLKYWHHGPSNTTYAWDATGGSQTTKKHHLDAADEIAADHGGNQPLGSPDWEGGFFEQNEMGRHPADLWGLPSQVDYASIQGDGDYGASPS